MHVPSLYADRELWLLYYLQIAQLRSEVAVQEAPKALSAEEDDDMECSALGPAVVALEDQIQPESELETEESVEPEKVEELEPEGQEPEGQGVEKAEPEITPVREIVEDKASSEHKEPQKETKDVEKPSLKDEVVVKPSKRRGSKDKHSEAKVDGEPKQQKPGKKTANETVSDESKSILFSCCLILVWLCVSTLSSMYILLSATHADAYKYS